MFITYMKDMNLMKGDFVQVSIDGELTVGVVKGFTTDNKVVLNFYIKKKDNDNIVTQINENIATESDYELHIGIFDYDKIQGIPLIDSLITAAGFEKLYLKGGDGFYIFYSDNIGLDYFTNTTQRCWGLLGETYFGSENMSVNPVASITYFHELQHLMYIAKLQTVKLETLDSIQIQQMISYGKKNNCTNQGEHS